MGIVLKDIAYHLPEGTVTNETLGRENPSWDMPQIEGRAGVRTRHIAKGDETALDLAVRASQKLFQKNPGLPGLIDAVIFCTQSPDYIMPPNACVLHKELGLSEDSFCFDFNLACSGYVYGLALVRGLLLSGMVKNVLFAAGDTYSKYVNPKDRATRVLFGDGAAVTWLAEEASPAGIIDIQCATSGQFYDRFIIPGGACRKLEAGEIPFIKNSPEGRVFGPLDIHMDGMAILGFINSKVPAQIEELLGRNHLTVDEIDQFIFHQASRLVLDSLIRLLEIKPEKVFVNLDRVGNTVSASIPIALKDAIDHGRISSGHKVLLSGFGVGLSWASALIQV